MKMIWAVVRSSSIEAIARGLKGMGVGGCTLYPVRGYGEAWHLYEPLIHGGHHKLEAIVDDDQASKVAKWITEHASTGVQGDGVLCVLDLASVVDIQSKERRTNS